MVSDKTKIGDGGDGLTSALEGDSDAFSILMCCAFGVMQGFEEKRSMQQEPDIVVSGPQDGGLDIRREGIYHGRRVQVRRKNKAVVHARHRRRVGMVTARMVVLPA